MSYKYPGRTQATDHTLQNSLCRRKRVSRNQTKDPWIYVVKDIDRIAIILSGNTEVYHK